MKPKCHICKEETEFAVVIEDLERMVVCKECFEEKKEQIIKQITQRAGREMMNAGVFPIPGKNNKNQDFLIDLTEEIKERYEPVLFREQELNRVTQILLRKSKNNPVLIGEAGVGKTAIADLLAYKIATGEIPRLKEYKVYSLNIASFMSGTNLRGDLEKKFELLVKKLSDKKSILFVDEMHLLMGAGGSSHNEIDISNLLKPYLSSGKIKLFGATTLDEYRTIEKNAAFNRRFQKVVVPSLTKEQTLDVMKKIKENYQDHHGVKISDECLETIVELSNEYIKDRQFPDKAIDILDEVCSMVSLKENAIPTQELKELEREFKELVDRLDIDQTILSKKMKEARKDTFVTLDTVYKVVENMTKIPVTKLSKEEKNNLLKLEDTLKKRLIGQDQAIDVLVKSVKRSRMKIKRSQKPTVLFFAGPTGTGKTESVKALAEAIFGNEEGIIRFDMSEYMEKHTTSKLIGSPPGYVGHEEEGQLTEKVRRNPYSIVLMDEFEKAHPDVSKLCLQVFDDGRLTDSKGRVVDFRNTLIILTSNIGVKEKKPVGFGEVSPENNTLESLKKMYAPEFLNRIDEIITFNQLSEKDIAEIVELRISEYQESLNEKGIELKMEDEVKTYLAKKGYNSEMGARPLSRVITKEVEDLIIDYLLENEDIDKLVLKEINGELQVSQ